MTTQAAQSDSSVGRPVRLTRLPDGGYVEPVTGTKIYRLDHYGSEGHKAGQTVWEMQAPNPRAETALVQTLDGAREFLRPFVELAE